MNCLVFWRNISKQISILAVRPTNKSKESSGERMDKSHFQHSKQIACVCVCKCMDSKAKRSVSHFNDDIGDVNRCKHYLWEISKSRLFFWYVKRIEMNCNEINGPYDLLKSFTSWATSSIQIRWILFGNVRKNSFEQKLKASKFIELLSDFYQHMKNVAKKCGYDRCECMCVYGIFTYIFWLLQNVSWIFDIFTGVAEAQVTESDALNRRCIDDINLSL